MPDNSFSQNIHPKVAIEDPQMKALAVHILNSMKLGAIKGFAHELDPQTYPLASDAKSIEQIISKYFKKHPQKKQEIAKEFTKEYLKQPLNVKENMFGKLAKVDFCSKQSIEEQINKLGLSDLHKVKIEHLKNLCVIDNTITMKKDNPLPSATPYPSGLNLGSKYGGGLATTDPIEAKYKQLGGKNGFLGEAIGGRGKCPDGKGKFQHYKGGSIYWSKETYAHVVLGLIKEKWKSLGWETSFLGYPVTDEITTPDTKGRYSHFQGGSIYYSPESGTHEIHGAIRNKWIDLGCEQGYLGYPTTDETPTPDTIGRFNHFQGGSIYYLPELGANAVHKNIAEEWKKYNWELGFLGYPINDTVSTPSSKFNKFQGGKVTWYKATGKTEVLGQNALLRSRIHRVDCLDETNLEGFGDQIEMSGVASSLNNGSVAPAVRFSVSDDFEDGDSVPYIPPREFFTFGLKDSPGWPKSFMVVMSLAEIDEGGFGEFLSDLLTIVRDKVVHEVATQLGQLTGEALSVYFGALGKFVGELIGKLIDWILTALLDWIISWFEDDMFPVFAASMTLPTIWARWNGHLDSPEGSFWTQAHGGKYQVWFDWELIPGF